MQKKTENKFEFSIAMDGVLFYIFDNVGKKTFDATAYAGPLHSHYTHELHYVHSGYDEIRTDHETVLVSKGELCFIRRNLFHSSVAKDMERTCFNLEVGVDGASEEGKKKCQYINSLLDSIDTHRTFVDKHISVLMGEVPELREENSAFPEARLGMILVSVVLRVLDLLAGESTPRISLLGNPVRSRAFERQRIIERHIAESFLVNAGLPALAAKLYLSEKQTGILVKRLMGKSYQKLVAEQRMKVAMRLIHRREKSLLEIAHAVGYASYSGFYAAFTKAFGKTPEEVRAEIKES